jgi:hypothetical protein
VHPRLLAIVGVIIFCAGLDLLWQSRREAAFWFASYMHVFRSLLREQKSPATPFTPETGPGRSHKTLAMLLGMGLALAGPLLIAVSLTLILYPKL